MLVVNEESYEMRPDTSPGNWWDLLTADAIDRACKDLDDKVARVDALLDDVGASAVVEALRRRGVLREEW
jgi:hypothetical protein